MEGFVTALEPQARRGGKRVNVFINDSYALSVQSELADSLRVGQFLSPSQCESLIGDDEWSRGLDAALQFLGHRPRSEREIRTRLRSKGYSDAVTDHVISRLTELKLVDDQEFAAYWVEQRQGRSPRGRRLIDRELRAKGVAVETIEAATQDSADEAELAYQAGLKKARALAGFDEQTFKQRLGGYLQRRGFDWESISAALRRLSADLEEPQSRIP